MAKNALVYVYSHALPWEFLLCVCVCVCLCVASELLPERGGKLLGCEITVSFLETWHRKLSLSQRLGCCVFQLYSELCHSLLKGLPSQCWEDKL